MSFRQRLRHDAATGAYLDGDIRYMMIRPDALMGLFARLDPPARAAALEALGASITEHGGRSAATYVTPERVSELVAIIAATAPELGWGVWRFVPEGRGMRLVVTNSPFAAGATFEGPACHAIVGMLRAVGAMIYGPGATAAETACANGREGADECHFIMEPAR
ncbi:hypothetical protein [Acuticoccus mangrovi]|uniref:4-vinyl reductase 4VR domain-containing protein n=1 Tax=Acuticoccus mangrovi TaxID=2796142 RepID=A0A934IVH1_9HYPH|nr:hypothetical protein [Acuticoccus mangrovi]MBJ3778882.1 hypothetical protein [Acuticoccus mangrovi]